MDKTDLEEKREKRKKAGLIARARRNLKEGVEKRKADRDAPLLDVITFVLGFIFAGCHIILGAHPVALAFISVLPCRVWLAALGAVVGSLTMGKGGIIYAMISVIVVFLRIIVSGGEKEESAKPSLFGEGLLLRLSGALIGGFIAAIYEILLRGFTLSTVAFGCAMVLLPPLIGFALSGLFDTGISFDMIFRTDAPVLSFKDEKEDTKRFNVIFFTCSALFLLFLASLSLKEYRILGIDTAYIFCGIATFFASRRFGALRGCAAGFAAALGLDSMVAVAFALCGLAAGVLMKLGSAYSIIGGAVALGSWCLYSGGITGLLSALPEYAISAAVSVPLMKSVKLPKAEAKRSCDSISASEMVGTMALSYRSRFTGALDLLESALSRVSTVAESFRQASAKPTKEELADLIIETKDRYCRTCRGYEGCLRSGGADLPDYDSLATILHENGRLDPTYLSSLPDYCGMNEGICESINRAYAILSKEKYNIEGKRDGGRAFKLLSELIGEARLRDSAELGSDEELSARLAEALDENDLCGGTIRAFGARRKHIIVAAEDEKGDKISSPKFKKALERIGGFTLGRGDFYRRDRMALMEISAIPTYLLECATASVAGGRDEVSGDSTRAFETQDGHFYALISDGMGRGSTARATSQFVCSFLEEALSIGGGTESVLRLLNHELICRHNECSATADIFAFDRFTGEASFYKSGSAPSYVKRGSSIFRIRSRTAPLGDRKSVV